jgi:hypothetical protein
MDTIDMTGRVIRAALGYQSTKALTLARDHLSKQEWLEHKPLEVYSMACFFKFSDLAKLSSGYAVKRPVEEWVGHRQVMGRTGWERLDGLCNARVEGLFQILDRSLTFNEASGTDTSNSGAGMDIRVEERCGGKCSGGGGCADMPRMEVMWATKVDQLKSTIGAGSELLELLEVDLRGGWCETSLVALGRNIQWCIVEARGLPASI